MKEHKNCNCWQFLLGASPALRSFVAATFSGCLPFKWRSEEKLFICLAIDFVAIGVSGDALLNVPPPLFLPIPSLAARFVSCHVATVELLAGRRCLWTSENRSQQRGKRQICCMSGGHRFWWRNALIFHSSSLAEFPTVCWEWISAY